MAESGGRCAREASRIGSGVPTRPCRCRSRPRPLTRNGSGFGTCEGVNLTFWGPAKAKN